MPVFFGDGDYRTYLDLLVAGCAKAGTRIWAYCLMPNHVHLILVPKHPDGLRAALGEAHRRYTNATNQREGWRGHLWQERFHSFVLDNDHLVACARYVELNPVRAGLVKRARAWRWSSARAHLGAKPDGVVAPGPLLEQVADWPALLAEPLEEAALEEFRSHGRTGRALGSNRYLAGLERRLGRSVEPRPRGRPRTPPPASPEK